MTVYLIKFLPTKQYNTPHYFPMSAGTASEAVRLFCQFYVTTPVILDVYGPPMLATDWAQPEDDA